MPVIGFLHAGAARPTQVYIAAFRQALAEAGYVENQNVAIEHRYADAQYERLPALAADLVRRGVALIVAVPSANAVRAAKAASSTLPIVFLSSDNPVKLGLVASLNRPGGNATGVNWFNAELGAKRLGLLRELLPAAARVGVLVNPTQEITDAFIKDLIAAASTINVQLQIAQAGNSDEIDAAFVSFVRDKADALMVAPDTFFANRYVQIVTLATRPAIPASDTVRAYVDSGGLMSYGTNLNDAYRQLALYTSRILKGEKPADLPVVQLSTFDLIINLRTAKALGLDVPPTLLARADEVIE